MIERGSLVGDGVILGENARLGPFERVSRRKQDVLQELGEDGEDLEDDEDSEDEWENAEKRKSHLIILVVRSVVILIFSWKLKIKKTHLVSWAKAQMRSFGPKALPKMMKTRMKLNASITSDS